MNFTTLHPPLIADPDPSFLHKLAEDIGATLAPPVTVATSKALEDQLEHGRYVFSGIFVNLDIAREDTIEVLSKIRRTRPSTPIYLITSKDSALSPLSKEQLNLLTVRERMPKPFSYMQVLKRVTAAQTPESQQIQYIDETSESGRVEIAHLESEFIPILTSQFLAGVPSHFNLYIRLSEKRFIKILREGDSLGHDRLEFYRKKTIEHFYIRRNSFEKFHRQCHEILMCILENPNVGASEKTHLTLAHGKQVMAFLRSKKVSPASIKYAQDFVDSVLKLTTVLKLEEIPDIKNHLRNPDFRDHASTGTLISAIIGGRLGFRGEKMLSLLGAASFLHDIGLPLSDIKFLEGNEAAMNTDELKAYRDHPTRGAEILTNLGSIDPLAIQAVAQHHERRNRKGFPELLGAGQINLISEVVGISDEFMHVLSRCSGSSNHDPIREMEENSFDGFSAQVIDAFKQCFGRI